MSRAFAMRGSGMPGNLFTVLSAVSMWYVAHLCDARQWNALSSTFKKDPEWLPNQLPTSQARMALHSPSMDTTRKPRMRTRRGA
jgi:hypothetical protein